MKAGYVALIGKPNVGKSTLMNAIIGHKLSIVSNKPQTTRQQILGILTTQTSQIIFIDTPGIIEPQYALQMQMVKHVEQAVKDCDIVVLLLDPFNTKTQIQNLKDTIVPLIGQKTTIVVLNKIDTLDANARIEYEHEIVLLLRIQNILSVSAVTGENIQKFIALLEELLPEHLPYFPEDILSDRNERFFVSEIIREKIFELFYDEIPYSTAVMIGEFKERAKGKTYIQATIVVERETQKKIIIGKNGEAIKKIGQHARVEIEAFLQKEIYLELRVTVRKKWRQNETMLRQFGYAIP